MNKTMISLLICIILLVVSCEYQPYIYENTEDTKELSDIGQSIQTEKQNSEATKSLTTTSEESEDSRDLETEEVREKEHVRNLEWFYHPKNGPLLKIGVGTSIDPFTYSTRAFVVPEGSLEYGRDVSQSLLFGRCGSSGDFEGHYSIEFCAHVFYFKEKGWGGKILDMYVFDSYHGYVFDGTRLVNDIESHHKPEEYKKIKIYVPEIDDSWLVDYEYISSVNCEGETQCSAYLEKILPKIKEEQDAIDPKNIEWNQCKNMMEVVVSGGTCYQDSGEFEGRTCQELVHVDDYLKYHGGTCCELWREKYPKQYAAFKCK